jgi:membrane protease YdiL (CAAX protease family)
MIMLGELGYLAVAGPGAPLLERLTASLPLPATLAPLTALLAGELLLCALLLGAVGARDWWRLAGLAADQPIRLTLRQCRPTWPLLAALIVLVIRALAAPAAAPGQRTLTHTPAGVVVALLVTSMLLVGFNEELLFRGLALGALLRERGSTRLGVWQAVVTTSVLFGLAHLIRGGPILGRVELAGGTAAIGLGFAGVRLWSGSIWPTVTAHALGNSLQLVGALSVGYFASSVAHGPPWWVLVPLAMLFLLPGIALTRAYLDREHIGTER